MMSLVRSTGRFFLSRQLECIKPPGRLPHTILCFCNLCSLFTGEGQLAIFLLKGGDAQCIRNTHPVFEDLVDDSSRLLAPPVSKTECGGVSDDALVN
jgi:hypothetical protein